MLSEDTRKMKAWKKANVCQITVIGQVILKLNITIDIWLNAKKRNAYKHLLLSPKDRRDYQSFHNEKLYALRFHKNDLMVIFFK